MLLPQVFLKGKVFLGYYSTVQHLEDSNLLDLVVSEQLCAHYRSYLGHVFYPQHSRKCNQCHLPHALKVAAAPDCEKSHDLCCFFEQNQIGYQLEVGPSPCVRLFGEPIEVKRIIEFVSKGVLVSVLNKQRCHKCLAKTSNSQCKTCLPPKQKASRLKRVPAVPSKLYQQGCTMIGSGVLKQNKENDLDRSSIIYETKLKSSAPQKPARVKHCLLIN